MCVLCKNTYISCFCIMCIIPVHLASLRNMYHTSLANPIANEYTKIFIIVAYNPPPDIIFVSVCLSVCLSLIIAGNEM